MECRPENWDTRQVPPPEEELRRPGPHGWPVQIRTDHRRSAIFLRRRENNLFSAGRCMTHSHVLLYCNEGRLELETAWLLLWEGRRPQHPGPAREPATGGASRPSPFLRSSTVGRVVDGVRSIGLAGGWLGRWRRGCSEAPRYFPLYMTFM